MREATSDLAKLRILIVDDERSVVKLLQMMLRDMGITQTFTAKDGAEALKFLGDAGNLVNLIICDWNMPQMTGLELLQQIRATDSAMAFMMVTGRATVDAVRDAKCLGVNAYVAKPFSQDQIRKKLEVLARDLT
jgi:two-component system, chemotaxis family, chemotaxis protein CheY